MLDNLDTYLESLRSGKKPLQVRHGFMHIETHGAIAIDQSGTKGKSTQMRLYVYPDLESEILHLITIGDKQSQHEDNESCREFILELRDGKHENEGTRDDQVPPDESDQGEIVQ